MGAAGRGWTVLVRDNVQAPGPCRSQSASSQRHWSRPHGTDHGSVAARSVLPVVASSYRQNRAFSYVGSPKFVVTCGLTHLLRQMQVCTALAEQGMAAKLTGAGGGGCAFAFIGSGT